jgi:hypothetical protein
MISDERGGAFPRGFVHFLRWAAIGLSAATLAGCSIALPSLMRDDDVTGSIKAQPRPFAGALDEGDWRIAEPRLAMALKSGIQDPPQQWSNPASGHGGAFQPVASAFKRDGRTCRAFLARINAEDGAKTLQGVGCLLAGDAVAVDEAQPWKAL